jgi:hypothetical protein
MTRTQARARILPHGVTADARGTVALTGPALRWLQRLDAVIVRAAASWGAEEHSFPPIIDVGHLARVDYFRSFPHLMTVPATLPDDEAALDRFTASRPGADGTVSLTEHAAVEQALLPAACYPVYATLEGARLDAPALVTTRATCFRRERRFVPLRRQWAFTMREVVCVGSEEEVTSLLQRGRRLVTDLCASLDVAQEWVVATDPFFRPAQQGRYLYQRLNPVKHEAVVDDLAIASVNRHHEHFGDAFEICRDALSAQSGCLAFGLERWLAVVAHRWGADPCLWPDPAVGSGNRA